MPARSARRRVHAALVLAVVAALAGCAGPRGYESAHRNSNYAPPGPPGDPWGPYISEASLRFGVPQQWIRAVMHQESGGREDALSSAGAMGLMQVIPSTYATLRARYGLGDDPYEPHDNIMAGAAYIREMYDRYGAPGFLAAYNAGPNRLDSYLANGTPLPDETVGYLSNIAPRLGPTTQLSGPLAVYAGNSGYGASAPYTPAAPLRPPLVMAAASGGSCDPDAAFDPDRPCTPAATQASPVYAPAPSLRSPVVLAAASTGPCDPNAAFDPTRRCTSYAPQSVPAPVVTASSVYVPPPPVYAPPVYARPAYTPPVYPPPVYPPPVYARPVYEPPHTALHPPPVFSPAPAPRPTLQLASLSVLAAGAWSIQVGAFATPAAAREAADNARRTAPDLLTVALIDAPPTTPFGGAVLYRARLASLTQAEAAQACARLSARGSACMTVPPGR